MYQLKNLKNEFQVYEIKTEQVIFSAKEKSSIQKKFKFLKGGGAFNGFTPSFIVKKNEKNSNAKSNG